MLFAQTTLTSGVERSDMTGRFSREREQKKKGRSRRPLYHAKNGSLVLLAALFRAALF